jgi:Rieske Fe-S protein
MQSRRKPDDTYRAEESRVLRVLEFIAPMGTPEDRVARRQVLQAGITGAALLATQGACEEAPRSFIGDEGGSEGDPGPQADTAAPVEAGADSREEGPRDAGSSDAPPEATLVGDSGSCTQTHYTHPVSILGAAIDMPGTSTAFVDDRYLDPVCSASRILLIHPVTREAYVALSGVCTHLCCDFTGGEGGPSYLSTYTRVDGGVLTDVVFCTCHGSLFSALDGSVLSGPGGNPLATGLEVLSTCEGGGFVFVSIPTRSS